MAESEVWKLIKKFCSQNSGTISWYILFSAMGKAVETLLIPRLLAKIFTEINDFSALKRNIFFFLIVFTVEKILYLASTYINKRIEPRLTSFLTVEFIEAIFRKYETTHMPIDVAVTMEKINIIRQVLEDLIYYVYKLIPVLIVIVVTIISVFVVNIKLGFFVLTSMIALTIILYNIPKPKDVTKQKDAMYIYIEDIFRNMEIISSNEGGLPTAKRGITSRVESLGRNRIKTGNKVGFNQGIGYLVSTLLYIGSIIFLYKLYKKGEVSTKTFEAYILTLGNLFKLAYDISYYLPDFMHNIQILMHNAPFINELFSYKHKDGIDVDIAPSDILFDNVTFNFGSNNILTNFSYRIQSGNILVLYGTSGSGKTTFTNLILDILQPTQGNIFIGEYTTDELSKKSIRCHIANVGQNTTSLLRISIYSNIIYGFEDTPELRAKVEALVEEYNLHRIFVHPDFLDLPVGKGGLTLSGGQKQIVHLLHAAINNKAEVIILDEPTSALDSNSKQDIIRLIRHLNAKGRTIILITHDPEMKAICNSVLSFQAARNPIEE